MARILASINAPCPRGCGCIPSVLALLTAPRRAGGVLLAVLLALTVGACATSLPAGTATYGPGSAVGSGSLVGPTAAAALSGAGSLAPASQVSRLPRVLVPQLPAQAVDALRLVASGGPYPYAQDGATFSNREGLLPPHASGWYHEFTVVTPGSADRGARRIIAGRDGGRFYTDDHYASFREVLSGVSS
jgi:ribonuclease T1